MKSRTFQLLLDVSKLSASLFLWSGTIIKFNKGLLLADSQDVGATQGLMDK